MKAVPLGKSVSYGLLSKCWVTIWVTLYVYIYSNPPNPITQKRPRISELPTGWSVGKAEQKFGRSPSPGGGRFAAPPPAVPLTSYAPNLGTFWPTLGRLDKSTKYVLHYILWWRKARYTTQARGPLELDRAGETMMAFRLSTFMGILDP